MTRQLSLKNVFVLRKNNLALGRWREKTGSFGSVYPDPGHTKAGPRGPALVFAHWSDGFETYCTVPTTVMETGNWPASLKVGAVMTPVVGFTAPTAIWALL